VTRTSQINVRVSEEQKNEWTDFAEESIHVENGLSELIRKSVTQFIRSGGEPPNLSGSGDEVPDDLSRRLSAIEDTLGDVRIAVDRVDDGVEYLEKEIASSDETSLSDQLMRVIPPAVPEGSDWVDLRDEYEDHPTGEPIIWEGTAGAFAQELDAQQGMVRQTLNQLALEPNDPIERQEVDGEMRYWALRDPKLQPYADGRTREAQQRQQKRDAREESRNE